MRSRLTEAVENAWLGLGDTSELETANPLQSNLVQRLEDPLVHLLTVMRDPAYFGFTCKHLFNKLLTPIQLAVMRELWVRPFPMLIASRGFGKSFLLGLYTCLRLMFNQGVKVVVVGAGFRQSKIIFDYAEEIWSSAPMFRDVCSGQAHQGPRRDIDRCTFRVGDSVATFIPLGDGSKIRGLRANVLVGDEFASTPNEIFENVVSGFAAVSMDPIEKVRQAARRRVLEEMGLWEPEAPDPSLGLTSNQTVIAGTAYYGFNHFCRYWAKWKAIVESRGDERKLAEVFGGQVPEKFDWRDYSVIRIPWDLLPDGFMDEKHVQKARATIHLHQYLMEYAACFSVDSNGFFRRTLIESCVVGRPGSPVTLPESGEVAFSATMRGRADRRYVMAVDPASEQDNFSVIVLELWPDHRRVVYCWTTTKAKHRERLQKGLSQDQDFYTYAARKIRDLLRLFPCERVALDSQGGGVAVREALGDERRLRSGEARILPVVDEDKPQDTDMEPGEHILEMVNFVRAEWVSAANHGLRKDMEDKVLLFPAFDAAEVGLALAEDRASGRVREGADGDERVYDTLEDCVMEIEELKDELASIVHTQTGTSMRDRWDTPEVRLAGGKKGRLRKDRYSALLMANMAARQLSWGGSRPEYRCMGGFAHAMPSPSAARPQRGWRNPDWYTRGVSAATYGAAVSRGKESE